MMDCEILKRGKEDIQSQASQLNDLSEALNNNFVAAVQKIANHHGRIAISGIGKSGLIGQKIASTLSSTGTPSYFIHSAEALHGDMGMLHKDDLLILISNSGETKEVKDMMLFAKGLGVFVIAMAGKAHSALASGADIFLNIGVPKEICPNNLAPTSSTLTTLCLGDVLAVSVMRERSFSETDFARLHPGGSLGRKLLKKVSDIMITTNLPIVGPDEIVSEAVLTMTSSRLGLCLVMQDGNLLGMITDGDLRRGLQELENVLECTCDQIMSCNPITVSPTTSIMDAEKILMQNKIKSLVVISPESKQLLGVADLFGMI